MSIKFFDKVTETVNQTNKDWLGVVNAGDDLIGLIEVYMDPTSTKANRELAVAQFSNNFISALSSYNTTAQVLAVETSLGILTAKTNIFNDVSTVQNFAEVISAFGGLVESIGILSSNSRIEFAGILLTSYGIVMKTVGEASASSGFGGWFYDFINTAKETKAEAMGYATTLIRTLDPSFTEATARVFIDASKNNDSGIIESVEYIKNIRKLLGIGTDISATSANDVYDAVQETRLVIQALFGDSEFQTSDVSNARNDLSAFLSLYYLVPFSIKPTDTDGMDTLYQLHATIADKWNADRNLTPEQIANGEANFSDQYLADRTAMLAALLKVNLDEVDYAQSDSNPFIDNQNNIQISASAVFNNPSIIFGDNDAETLSGGLRNDHIYGGEGNDQIFGLDGNDYIEGNAGHDFLYGDIGNDTLLGGAGADHLNGGAGNDILKGGSGADIYEFDESGYGIDIVNDSDGEGSIRTVNTPINNGSLILNNIYKNESSGFTFSKVNGGNTVIISKEDDSSRIIVQNWTEGDLNLNLTGTAPLSGNVTLSGDFKKKINDQGTPDTADDVFVIENNNYVSEESQTDALDLLTGTAGNDVIDGKGGSDAIIGKEGNDYLIGGTGGDYILGGLGKDTLIGGSDDDSIYGSHETTLTLPTNANHEPPVNQFSFQQGTGFNWHMGYNTGDTYENGTPIGYSNNIGRVRLDGDEGNTINGGTGNDFIAAGTGSDYVSGGADKDLIFGMDKADILFGDGGNDVIYGDGDSGNDNNSVVWALAENHGDDIIDGGDGNDILFGQGGDDVIFGGIGNDQLWGDDPIYFTEISGNDFLFGGEGNDLLVGGKGNDYLEGGAGKDTLNGGEGDDVLIGTGDGDILFGGAGADTIYVGNGDRYATQDKNDKIKFLGGGNINNASVSLSESSTSDEDGGVLLSLGNGFSVSIGDGVVAESDSTITFADGSQILHSSLLGSKLNEQVNIISASKAMFGGALDDYLEATGTEQSTLFAGEGNDVLIGNDGNNILNADIGNDTLSGGIGEDTLNGGEGNDSLGGGTGNDLLDGGLGVDSLFGGDGDDTYIVDDIGDLIIENNSEGIDVVQSSVTYSLSSNVENLFLTGSENINAFGNELDNVIYGNDSQNILDGANGNDSLLGGAGNDILNGGNGNDTLEGGSGNDVLNGGVDNDILFGNEGNDTIIGGVGSDDLQGGVGDDTYVFNLGDGEDVISDTNGLNAISFGDGITLQNIQVTQYQGDDGNYYLRVQYSEVDSVVIKDGLTGSIQQYQFGDGSVISHADLIGTSDVPFEVYGTVYSDSSLYGSANGDIIDANTGDDQAYGLDGDDILNGESGNDSLYGGNGDDTLDGGSGNDLILGGSGSDSYIFRWGMGKDTVIDGSDEEMNSLRLDIGITLSDLDSKRLGDDLFIHFKTTDDGVVLKDYYAGNYQWQITDASGQTTGIQDFLDITDNSSAIQKEFDNYESKVKAFYFTSLAAEGFRLQSDGYFHKTTTEVENSLNYSRVRVDYEKVNFQTYTQFSGDYDITRLNIGEYYDMQELYRNVSYGPVFSGSGSGNTFGGGSSGGGNTNGSVFIPNGQLQVSPRAPINGVITGVTPTPNGVWVYFTPNPIGNSAGTFEPTQNIIVNEAYESTTLLSLEKIFADDSDNNINIYLNSDPMGSLVLIDAGSGDDSIAFNFESPIDDNTSQYFNWGQFDRYGAMLYGNSGNDSISGSFTADTLIGGDGDDLMNGLGGADTYLFMLSDIGIDTINETTALTLTNSEQSYFGWYYNSLGISNWYDLSREEWWTGTKILPDVPMISGLDYEALQPLYANGFIPKDTVEFGEGINFSDISLSWGDKTLNINWGEGKGVKIDMPVHYQYNPGNSGYLDLYSAWINQMKLGAGIEQFKFADGSIISMAEMLTHLPPIPSMAPILFNLGDGSVIKEMEWSNVILFDAEIRPEHLKLTHDGLDLLIKHSNGIDQLRIPNWYENLDSPPNIFAFFEFDSDGSTYLGTQWTADELYEMGLLVEGTNGNDILTSVDSLENQFYGLEGNDFISGGTGDEYLNGGGGDDTINGEAGDDEIEGEDGNDIIYGGTGDDYIDGGAGEDTMIGGAGDDYYLIDNIGDVVSEDVDGGYDYIESSVTYTLGANIEELALTGTDAINATGNDLDNVFYGNGAANIFAGGLGSDIYHINSGNGAENIFAGGFGNDFYHIYSGDGNDTIYELENSITDTDVIELSNVSPANVTLQKSGDDLVLVYGDDSSITITGWYLEGSNTIEYINFSYYVFDEYGNYVSYEMVTWDKATISANAPSADGDLVINGTVVNDTLIGGLGNDTINGLSGVDTMSGGYGNDVYFVDRTTDKVIENSNEGIDTVNATASYTLSANVENLTLLGTSGLLANGNELNNVLIGNSGNNTLDGKLGSDTLAGGLGNDTYVVDDAGDVVTELENEGIDTVKSSIDYTLGDHVERLILTGTSAVNGTGNELNNILTGNEIDNVLTGGDGNDNLNGGLGQDVLIGGSGNDTYVVDNELDTVIEFSGEGNDKIQSSITYTLSNEVEDLILTGNADINGYGNELDNSLTGNSANNLLEGGTGNDVLKGGLGIDTLIGGIGNDIYVIDDTDDLIVEYADEGIDRVNSSIDYALGDEIENLTLTGTTAISGSGNNLNNTIVGNALNNVLLGNAGNDILNGSVGADTMLGGLGDDTYIVDNASDTVVEHTNEGIDKVNSSISYLLGENLENLTLTGNADVYGIGNSLSNTIIGNIGSNYLYGLDGEDLISGNSGNDILQGGNDSDILNSHGGNDLLDGSHGVDRLNGSVENDFFTGGTENDHIITGTGHDVIAFNKGDGQDTVSSSVESDNTISLGGSFSYGDLSLSKLGNNLILKMGTTDQITLQNWYASSGTNKSVMNLQVIAEAMQQFELGSTDELRNNKVETFNFASLIDQFDSEGSTANWQLTDERLTAHLQSGSDTAAIGGDLAYQYGLNSNLTGMGALNTQSIINNASFGQAAQTLNNPTVWQAETVKLA